jgi:hypothetical protein
VTRKWKKKRPTTGNEKSVVDAGVHERAKETIKKETLPKKKGKLK